ncbi:GtrA family protein [Saccharopolyspora spinosa]|uniref:Flippase GtrA n=1 Tax=Saccharopolyspora spinosa TaxID=60894 RepID=A0A2N3Y4F5_SACSN|nr:GtrA family protein [Saccharopolyspora spinosa]PKW17808.1 putative flippase GtrA [Saccharopolyspora spinosa]
MEEQATTTRTRAAERVGDLLTSWVDRLPSWLRRVVSRELVGFAILGAFTFLIDLAILASLRAWTPLPLPVAVTVSYVFAFGLNFVLNRTVNFRSHAPVGGQVLRYAMVVVCDYGLTIAVTTGVSALGVDFRLARLSAGACVALFTYTASRWWVFRQEPHDRPASTPEPDEVRPGSTPEPDEVR